MKKLAKILRFSIGVLIVLLAYAALIFFIRYIWDEVVFRKALLHKDLKVKTSHIYSNLSDNSGMWSA